MSLPEICFASQTTFKSVTNSEKYQINSCCICGSKLVNRYCVKWQAMLLCESGFTWCQFHQCFTHAFFVWKSFWQLLGSFYCSFLAAFQQLFGSFSLVTFGFVIFGAKILYEKCVCKTLMKLMARVNFTLQATVTPLDLH